MITSKIAANQAFTQINKIYNGEDPARRSKGNDDSVRTPAGASVDGVKADISSFSTHPLQQFNAEFNAVVKSIRIADKAMGEIEANVEQMASEVEMFLKQYPPYPPGSEDRIKFLSRFAMLRKQIDQLTLPHDAGARSIIGPPGEDGAKVWEVGVGGKKIGPSIRRQPMGTGRDGLGLPEISTASSDEQIRTLHKALGAARSTIHQRRGELAQDTTRLIQSAERMA